MTESAVIKNKKKNTVPVALSSKAHVDCPYAIYQQLHAQGRPGFDPDIGLAFVGYEAVVSLSKNTTTFSSSITQDGQGPRHMGIGEDPVQDDVEAIFEDAR